VRATPAGGIATSPPLCDTLTPMETLEAPPEPAVYASEEGQATPLAAGTLYKATVWTYVDTLLAKDVMQVTPHFQDNAGTLSAAQIATQLATACGTYFRTAVSGGVKLYHEDFNPAAPHPPLAVATFGTAGNFMGSVGPREVALALSYYSTYNQKRYRGRLFIPHAWLSQNQSTPIGAPGVRPTPGAQTGASNFYTQVINAVRASGVQWVVASTVDKAARTVSQWWVNDEWDIQRRRGLRETGRTTGPVT
jgi:hypothetical protein